MVSRPSVTNGKEGIMHVCNLDLFSQFVRNRGSTSASTPFYSSSFTGILASMMLSSLMTSFDILTVFDEWWSRVVSPQLFMPPS